MATTSWTDCVSACYRNYCYMKKAVVYERNGKLFVRSCSRTTDGVWIDVGPCVAIEKGAPPARIGSVVREAILSSVREVAHPTLWKNINDELLKEAGVRSWAVFSCDAKCVNVEQTEICEMKPTKNLGSKNGFVELVEQVVRVSSSAVSEKLGEAVLAALEFCE